MQSLDVQVQNPVKTPAEPGSARIKTGHKNDLIVKTGAETARNGSSFLAMIEKMIAGATDGNGSVKKTLTVKTAARGAGDATGVPDDGNILKKNGSDKTGKSASKLKSDSGITKAVLDRKKLPGSRESGEEVCRSIDCADVKKTVESEKSILEEASFNDEMTALSKKKKEEGNADPDVVSALLVSLMHTPEADKRTASLKTENPEKNGLEIKKTVQGDKKDKKTFISVRDERNESITSPGSDNGLIKSVKDNKDGTADMTIGFRSSENGPGIKSDTETRFMEKNDGKQGQSFASMLSSELRSNAADFVKTGSIVLRDNNSGLIRLSLHPESLGNVKISLELSDKKITGKIVVSSKEAYDAFNENLDGLSEAFVKGGFDSAGFDLSWSGQDSAAKGSEQELGKISSPFYVSSIPDVMLGQDTADIQTSGKRANGQIYVNMFA